MNSITSRGSNTGLLAFLAGITLLSGVVALLATSSPAVALLGMLAVSASLAVLVVSAITRLMRDAFAAHVLRNEDFHWY